MGGKSCGLLVNHIAFFLPSSGTWDTERGAVLASAQGLKDFPISDQPPGCSSSCAHHRHASYPFALVQLTFSVTQPEKILKSFHKNFQYSLA